MLKLSIERTEAVVPPQAPKLDDSRAEVWRDNQGVICAYGEIVGEEYWMHIPGLASFRFSSHGHEIAAVTNGSRQDLVLDAYRRSVLPMALQACGREVLHASGVRSSAGVVALCGVSETGKSTIAFGLSRRGYDLWADDAVVFEISDRSPLAISLPFGIRLHPSAAAAFDLPPSSPTEVYEDYPPPGLETAPLVTVCLLRRAEGAAPPVTVRRLTPVEAFGMVLAHAYCFTFQDGERKRRMMHQYLDLVAEIPIFDICFQSGLANLPSILDGIERVLNENILRKAS